MTAAQLRAVAEVMATGSVSVAARKLYLSQPAVTKQLRSLERELGTSLFERSGRRLVPTATARGLLPRIKSLIQTMEEISAVARLERKGDRGISGNVLVSSGPVFSQTVMPTVIMHCRRKHPNMRLVMFEGSIRDQIQKMRQGEIRIALGPGYLKDSDLRFESLLDDELVLITPIDHRLAGGKGRVSLAKIVAREPLITHLYAGGMEAALRAAGVPRRLLMSDNPMGARTTNTGTIMALVSQGLGISVVPRYLVDLLHGPRIALRELRPPLPIQFGYYHLAGMQLSPAEAVFMEVLKEVLPNLQRRQVALVSNS